MRGRTRSRAGTLGRRALLQGGIGATLPACLHPIKMDPQGWGSVLGTTYALPRWQWAPARADDIITAVRRAETERRRIRMTGSGYSFSDVAVNDDWLISPRALTQVLPVDTACLRTGVEATTLFRVQSGITVRALNAALDACGLALPNMGAFDGQTYVGAASTGTHGSGLAYGPLASQIVSIQVVGPGGEVWQVEPAGGMTDPSRFGGRLPEAGHIPVRLVQDDRLFNALAVGLGCLGVIYAVTLRATTKFWLVERRTVTTWEQLSKHDGVVDRILQGAPVWPALDPSPLALPACIPAPHADPDHIEINYTPYPDTAGEHVALLTLRWRTACEPPSVGGERGSLLFNIVQAGGLELDRIGVDLGRLTPSSTSAVQSLHARGMQGLADSYYANRSFDVFQIGTLDDLHVYGIELHFCIQKTREIVAYNLAEAARLGDLGIHHSSPPTLRFIKEASPFLSMQHGRPASVALEFGIFTDAFGAEELLRAYEDAMVGGTYGGRPHWGLDRNHIRGEAQARELYGDAAWREFRGALATLNPRGTFDGRITDRMGISHPSS